VAPAPTHTVPISVITDVVEVLVFDGSAGPVLAGAIELVSPANKDRAAHRDAFVSKCAAYLQQGIGLVVVDVVTDRRSNLHREILERLHPGSPSLNADLYAAAYRTVSWNDQPNLEVWEERLEVGSSLLILPLWLRGGLSIPVDLDGTYERTCREQRIPAPDS
jgi:hypothetical protein